MVRELHVRCTVGLSAGMVYRRIGNPRFPRVSEMVREAAPLVPFEKTVCGEKEEGEGSDYEHPDLGYLDQVTPQVVHDGDIHLSAERDRVLLGDWQGIGIKG